MAYIFLLLVRTDGKCSPLGDDLGPAAPGPRVLLICPDGDEFAGETLGRPRGVFLFGVDGPRP